jgi:hypothetical protein
MLSTLISLIVAKLSRFNYFLSFLTMNPSNAVLNRTLSRNGNGEQLNLNLKNLNKINERRMSLLRHIEKADRR